MKTKQEILDRICAQQVSIEDNLEEILKLEKRVKINNSGYFSQSVQKIIDVNLKLAKDMRKTLAERLAELDQMYEKAKQIKE